MAKRISFFITTTLRVFHTFRSKLNIWSDNEDHITFGGANTHMVSAWENWKTWINNDSGGAGTFHLYHTSSKTEFARFSGDGTSSFITGKFYVNGELEATSLDINGNADISGNLTGLDNVTSSYVTATNIIIGGHTVSDIDVASEVSNADDHLMTALAIKNKIEDNF